MRQSCVRLKKGNRFADEFPNAATTASGLRVPKAIGDFLILDALRDSGGTAVAVTDEELIAGNSRDWGGGRSLLRAGRSRMFAGVAKVDGRRERSMKRERVVLFNTGSGVKYMESFSHG